MLAALALMTLHAVAPSQAETRVLDVNAFSWSIEVERVVLGETEIAPITLVASRSDGSPLDIAPPVLKTSTGALSPPRRVAPGIWKTQYTPPKERFPHVALLSAQLETDAGLAVGFAAVPLWGKGRLAVKTKPNSDVLVFIGNLQFGPAKSDAKGVAAVDIIAPPGPERAVARSTDEVGNTKQETVDLNVPAFNRLSLIPLDDVAAADGTGEAQMLLYLVDKKGEAMIDAPVDVTATVGGLKQLPQGLSSGLFRLRYGPGITNEKTAKVTVSLQGAPASKSSVDVNLIPGGPKRATITQSVSVLRADEPREVKISVALFDQAGNPVPASAGSTLVDTGRLADQSDGRSAAPGADNSKTGFTTHYTWLLPAVLSAPTATARPPASPAASPTATAGPPAASPPPASPPAASEIYVDKRVATFSVRNRAGLEIASAKVTRVPGPAARLTISPVRELTADGQDAESFVVQVADVVGNPVRIEGLTVKSDLGEIKAPVFTDATMSGLFVPSALPPGDAADSATGTLTATLPREGMTDLVATANIRVVPARLSALLYVGVGVISDYNLRSYAASGPELSLLLRLPYLDGNLHAGLRLGALFAIPLDDGTGVVEGHVAVPVWAEGQWRSGLLDAVPDLEFHFGGAVGVTMSDRVRQDDDTLLRALAAAPTAMGIVGVGYPLGPGKIEGDFHLGFGWPLSDKLGWAPMATGFTVRYRFDSF